MSEYYCPACLGTHAEGACPIIAERDALRAQVTELEKSVEYHRRLAAPKTLDELEAVNLRSIVQDQDEDIAKLAAQVAAMKASLKDTAAMPEYDQDDAHRLRRKAEAALTGPFPSVVPVEDVLPVLTEYKVAIYWSVPHPDAPEPFTSEYLGALYNQAEDLITKLESITK